MPVKIVIATDSFKHSMTAAEACAQIAAAVSEVLPGAEVMRLPIADGGEGTASAMLDALGGETVSCRVQGPENEEIESYYLRLRDNTAVIEMAAICGLTLVKHPNPETTTTYGVGQMIRRAMDDGCRKILLCIGGSATNDAGIGAMSALGVHFRDADDRKLSPVGGSLQSIASIDASGIDPRLKSLEIIILCDVDNPLCGINGAAYVFAPQKGADAAMVSRLDSGLRHYARALHSVCGFDVAQIPGTGAAGGIGASLVAFCGAQLKPGIETVLNTLGFDEKVADAALVITGEGKTDRQTMSGKAVLGVSRRACALGVPVIVISGGVEDGVDELLYGEGVSAVFSGTRLPMPFELMREYSAEWLRLTAKNVIRAACMGIV